MFKLSSDHLANFRSVGALLETFKGWINELRLRIGNTEDRLDVLESTPDSVSGATDHGALTGLSDDDHTQYHNDTRGDARYTQIGHAHDAADVVYDNTSSGLAATDVQAAIDELAFARIADGDKGDITVSGSGSVWTLDLNLATIDAPTTSVNFSQQQATQFRIENRTSDPGSPAVGEIWLRTDL